MDLTYHIFATLTTSQEERLRALNADDIQLDGWRVIIFSTATYQKALPILSESSDLSVSKLPNYTEEDTLKSEYCRLGYPHTGGYPKPDKDYGYKEITYDKTKMCPPCCSPRIQKDAFRVTKAPHHKLWSFTSWVIDAYFADEETYEGVFRPLGIGCRPLRYYRKKDIIDGVVQIDIPVCNEPLDMLGYRYKICPVCGSVRYDNSDMPSPCFPLPEHPSGHIYMTQEYFGFGGQSDRRVIVSAELRNRLIAAKAAKWYHFAPCAHTPPRNPEAHIRTEFLGEDKWGKEYVDVGFKLSR